MSRIYKKKYFTVLVNVVALIALQFIFHNALIAQCTELLWADEFNSMSIDESKWSIEIDGDGGGNNELQFYTSRTANISVQDGILSITALKEDYLAHEYTSGKIYSQYKGDWRFGRIEARIKMPDGKGIWPAFWMLPTESIYGNWPNSGEIDIVELVGGGSGDSTIYGTLHFGPPWNYTNGTYKLSDAKFSDDYHIFAIEWSPESIKWYMDDILYSIKTANDVSHWKPFQEKFYVMLNLAVGGNWPGSPDESTVFPQTMQVDYVRVYGKPEDQGIVAIDSAYAKRSAARYSFTNIPDATFNWDVDAPDAAIVTGADSNVFIVNWGCDPGIVNLTVEYPNCGILNYSLPVSFSSFEIDGPVSLFPQQTGLVYSLPHLDNTDYTWNFPEGVTVLGNPDSSVVEVDWGCEPGDLEVIIENTCAVTTVSTTIVFDEPLLTGPSSVIAYSQNVSYAMTELPGGAYIWSVPEDAEIVYGQQTSKIKVNFGQKGGWVQVLYATACETDSLQLPVLITDSILLCDYETSFLTFKGWDDGVEPTLTNNPIKDAVNSSDHVGVSFKAASPWSGLYADLSYNLDLVMHNKFSVKVLGPKSGKVLFKLEDVGEGIDAAIEDPTETEPKELTALYSTPNQWQYLEFEFNMPAQNVYDRFTLFFDFGSEDTNTYYFDDISLFPSDTILFQQWNKDPIIEGEEDGKQIYIRLWYDQFQAILNNHNWNFENLPDGVVVDKIDRLSHDTVVLTLAGNTTIDYDEDIINIKTTINSVELKNATYDLTACEGITFSAIIETDIPFNNSGSLKIYPNPFSQSAIITTPNEKMAEIIIYDYSGNIIQKHSELNSHSYQLKMQDVKVGNYLVVVKFLSGNFKVNKLIKIE